MSRVTGQQIANQARTWLGTPFHHQASVKGHGCDCYGLVRGVARELGLVPGHAPITTYARQPDGKTILQVLQRELVEVPLQHRQPGDVLVFRWGVHPQHMGIMTEAGTIVHAYGVQDNQGRGTVETTLAGNHKNRLRNCFRFPEVAG